MSDNTKMDHTLPTRPWRKHATSWDRIAQHPYAGEGTAENPYVVTWLNADGQDDEDPMNMTDARKWVVTIVAAMSTMIVSMGSSMLSAATVSIMEDFSAQSSPVYIMITSGYIIGFVVGPLLWAPLSEIYGRRFVFLITYPFFTIFNAAASGSPNVACLIVLRMLAGVFGSSAMTNAGGTIADIFPASQRGMAMGVFSTAPFLGPAIGPVIGGFLSESTSWRYVAATLALFSVIMTVVGMLWLPETYSPVLLRDRALRISRHTNKEYRSQQDVSRPLDHRALFAKQIKVPWILMCKEPIVLIMSLYLAVIYAILYMQFTSFPLVFEGARHWTPGQSSLAFVGVTIGAFLALAYIVFVENPRYARDLDKSGGYLPPEARLPTVIAGAILLPIGLIIFAFTAVPVSIPWIAPLLATLPYGTGIVFLFLGVSNYLIDAYLIYAASVLAGGTVLRSSFGVVLPLFTIDIYDKLGITWASALIALLGLIFAPVPIILRRYGSRIRKLSVMARQADEMGLAMARRQPAAERLVGEIPRLMASDEECAIEGVDTSIELATPSEVEKKLES